jgi:cytochrome c-type biogenesis protein CcmH/NrfF
MSDLVRERIAAGDTNAQVIDFLVARYGEFVLLKRRFESETLLLWLWLLPRWCWSAEPWCCGCTASERRRLVPIPVQRPSSSHGLA